MNTTYIPTHNLITRHCKNILTILCLLASAACSNFDKKQHITSDNSEKSIASKNLASQCLLPSRIRKLSRNFMYLAPGSIIHTSQTDCITRGGKIISKI